MAARIKKLNLFKLKALLDYIKNLYPDKFGDLDIYIGHGQTRYYYRYNDKMVEIEEPTIIMGTISHTDFDDFIIDYYNKAFNMNLANTPEIRLIQEICHECGHHYNIDYYKDRDEEYAQQMDELEKYDMECEERRIAYRQIDEEADADKFAAEVMKNHIDALLACLE